jgi:hypothetical protein
VNGAEKLALLLLLVTLPMWVPMFLVQFAWQTARALSAWLTEALP